MRSAAHRIGLALLVIHSIALLLTILAINLSDDPQAPLLWAFLYFADFPVIFAYFVKLWICDRAESFCAALDGIVYFPHLAHGVLGSLWWYLLPRLLLPKRLGGVWGARVSQ